MRLRSLSEGLFTDLLLHLISEDLWKRALTLARDESFHKRAPIDSFPVRKRAPQPCFLKTGNVNLL